MSIDFIDDSRNSISCIRKKTYKFFFKDFCHEDACGSTEHFNCECENEKWSLSQIKSNPKKCIPERWVCDGKVDCADGSDEIECSCSENEFQCSFCERGKDCIGFVSHNLYQCIPKSLVNDTVSNCYSRKDEESL